MNLIQDDVSVVPQGLAWGLALAGVVPLADVPSTSGANLW